MGEGLLYEKDWSSSWIQIKDSGLTWGVDDETSPFLVVKVEKMKNKFKLKKPKLKKSKPFGRSLYMTCWALKDSAVKAVFMFMTT